MSPTWIQIIILSLLQGAAELLPVSSSAHVILAEKLMRLDPSSPALTFLLVMLHTGTMFAVIVYFWDAWKRSYFASTRQFAATLPGLVVATGITIVIGYALKFVIEKLILGGGEKAEVEQLFSNLALVGGALLVAGVLIIVAGLPPASSAQCRRFASPSAVFPARARRSPPPCCWVSANAAPRNSVSRWPSS
jgi:undecaprenyl-diphosphatase